MNIGLDCGHTIWVDIGAYAATTLRAGHPLDRQWHCHWCHATRTQVKPL
jgi:hypothetical protein